ncbi:MAG TPA: nitrile hydratase subunit alpha [Candidatus Binatia bacterium]|nr:nitrile hydratase subunit alpha [Candidatus Binatia bacterium]
MSGPRTRIPAAPAADRARALEEALSERELLPAPLMDEIARRLEHDMRPQNGAKVVARAWTDPSYRARLLADGTAACAELGYSGPQGEYIVVLENTAELHNVVVCTQCSCTAWPVLGLPPDWYKSPEYRARVVREPRRVLHEMGLDLPSDVTVRVWDTTAETRYLVLPLRPQATEGWNEERLASIVTREAMIGVARL